LWTPLFWGCETSFLAASSVIATTFFQKTSRSLRGFGAKLANPRPSFNTQNGQNENNPVKAADAKGFTN